MDNDLLIETKEIGNHRIKIYYDAYAECPVANWDMCGVYLFEYSGRYICRLHEACDWREFFSDNNHSLKEALQCMAAESVAQKDIINYLKQGGISGVRLVYNKSSRLWELQVECQNYATGKLYWSTEREFEPNDLKNFDFRAELIECLEQDSLIALINECAKDVVLKTWTSTGYSQGDYLSGVAFVTKDRYNERCGRTDIDWKQGAIRCIDEEVKEISMWAWGDVKGFTLEKKVPYVKKYQDKNRKDEECFDWEEVRSCQGFFLETEELIDEVISEYDLKEAA